MVVKKRNNTFQAFEFITFCFKSYVSFIYNSTSSKVAFLDLKLMCNNRATLPELSADRAFPSLFHSLALTAGV